MRRCGRRSSRRLTLLRSRGRNHSSRRWAAGAALLSEDGGGTAVRPRRAPPTLLYASGIIYSSLRFHSSHRPVLFGAPRLLRTLALRATSLLRTAPLLRATSLLRRSSPLLLSQLLGPLTLCANHGNKGGLCTVARAKGHVLRQTVRATSGSARVTSSGRPFAALALRATWVPSLGGSAREPNEGRARTMTIFAIDVGRTNVSTSSHVLHEDLWSCNGRVISCRSGSSLLIHFLDTSGVVEKIYVVSE